MGVVRRVSHLNYWDNAKKTNTSYYCLLCRGENAEHLLLHAHVETRSEICSARVCNSRPVKSLDTFQGGTYVQVRITKAWLLWKQCLWTRHPWRGSSKPWFPLYSHLFVNSAYHYLIINNVVRIWNTHWCWQLAGASVARWHAIQKNDWVQGRLCLPLLLH